MSGKFLEATRNASVKSRRVKKTVKNEAGALAREYSMEDYL